MKMHAVLLLLACAPSSAQLLVVQCGGTNDRFGRLHIDVLPRLQATIKLLSALFLDELRTWSTSQLLGCALTFIASGCYSRLKLLHQAR